MSISILRGDARSLPLSDSSAHLILTSPPYFALRAYSDNGEIYEDQIGSEPTPGEYLDSLIDCTREWMRVLKPDGSIFVNLGDKYSQYEGAKKGHGRSITGERISRGEPPAMPVSAPSLWGIKSKSLMGLPWRYAIRCIDELGLILRAEIVWDKPNGLPESVTDRVRRSHEQIFHFTLQQKYFTAIDEIREPHAASSDARVASSTTAATRKAIPGLDESRWRAKEVALNPLGKLPGSVWKIAASSLSVPEELGIQHFAAYPSELCRRIILGWSPEGGIVGDFFGGTGTTAMTADVLGRHGISVDRSADYCRLAQWRCSDPYQRAKVLGEKLEKVPVYADQPSLFEEMQ